ncbi:MAG: acetate/propionate family kinase [Armatimonadetes bacterium]|nr:acetate/propionate family kinase [Armatimonadota bacterium]
MNILVLNAGSSSQKMALFTVEAGANDVPAPIWERTIERTNDAGGAVAEVLRELLASGAVVHAVGHRVVHGGMAYRETTRITSAVVAEIERLSPLAPSHNPASLAGIVAVTQTLGGDVTQFAAFDTAFHRTLPDAAAIYGLPYGIWEEGVRRYGFHGISHRYCAERAAKLLNRDDLRIVSCHLGNGCSIAAIKNGVSVDTTMGFTPMDGLMMGTRSGSVDPGILLHLLQNRKDGGETPERLAEILNRESGLKGISGVSGDMREVAAAIAGGNKRARLAFDAFVHRLRFHIGAMLPALGGLDVLIFTGGIGEHSPTVRATACVGLRFLGIRLDTAKNDAATVGDVDVSEPDAPVHILVITTREDAAIAHDCAVLLADRALSHPV